MSLIDGGIEKVRAFELPAGIWANGEYVASPRLALIKWRSSWDDKLYQIYVNGQYAGATLEVSQRQMVVQLPTSLGAAVRIEVFAVEADLAYTDFSSWLDSTVTDNGRVRIVLLRSQNLPAGSTAQIYSDKGMGQIDYDNPLEDRPIRIWPAWQDKAGFGLSRFGISDFGFDSAGAVGCGKGCFGYGQFGLDADTLEWISEPMDAGVYKFAVRISDQAGNESVSSETGEVTVTPQVRPAERLSVSSFDKQTNQLVLSIS